MPQVREGVPRYAEAFREGISERWPFTVLTQKAWLGGDEVRSMKIAQAGDNFDVDATASRRLLDEVLARPLFAHLATDSEHGPRESPVWFLWEDETLWFIGNYQSDTFPKRIEREPRCAIGVVEFDIGGECRLHAFGSILQESRYTCTIRRMNRNVL